MSNRGPLLTDKLTSGTPLNLRREKGRSVAFSYSGDGKDRSKAYASNRNKPRKKKKK